ncbi:hypothetical protein D1007_27900 [Hordeum vulgare]|nr:hypothetical protein D1007_27900 [Hordeum vulgare]
MANHEAASIRDKACETLNLLSDGQHQAALSRAVVLTTLHPGSALALNFARMIHRHAALVARNDRGAHRDDDNKNASTLEKYHPHAALDAFSAAARLAPDCVVTNADHPEVLADCRHYEEGQEEFLRMLNTAENNNHANSSLYNMVCDKSGESEGRRRDAVKSAGLAMERFTERVNHRISRKGSPSFSAGLPPMKCETVQSFSPRPTTTGRAPSYFAHALARH